MMVHASPGRLRPNIPEGEPSTKDALARSAVAGPALTPKACTILLALFAALVILRLPGAWAHGRFLDEEATVFLAYAWHHPVQDALFRPFAGYWNLGADGAAALSVGLVKQGVVPLRYAPYLTMTLSLATQLLPAVLLLTGSAPWLARRIAVVTAVLLLALAPSTEEVFFNILHIQFHLALCAALILALDPPVSASGKLSYALLLFAAPLCGPLAMVLAPLFAARTLIDREAARLVQVGALVAGAALQFVFFYGASPMRGHFFGFGTIAAVGFVRLLALPALGFRIANGIGNDVYRSWAVAGRGWWSAAAASTMAFTLLTVVAARRRDGAIWLALAALSVAAVTFGYGMVIIDPHDLFSAGAGERYQFLPIVLLGWALLALAERPDREVARVGKLICALIVATGAIDYAWPLPAFANGPSWPAEVSAWQRDHSHPLAVWPRPWTADLTDRSVTCSPVGADPARSGDPRYCESGWVAGFHRPRP